MTEIKLQKTNSQSEVKACYWLRRLPKDQDRKVRLPRCCVTNMKIQLRLVFCVTFSIEKDVRGPRGRIVGAKIYKLDSKGKFCRKGYLVIILGLYEFGFFLGKGKGTSPVLMCVTLSSRLGVEPYTHWWNWTCFHQKDNVSLDVLTLTCI